MTSEPEAQEAGQKAAEANLAAWKQWSQFWGWK